jgi:hypothetical protein
MLVWGGLGALGELNTGGAYNPPTNTWTSMTTTNAPSAREFHTAVWTGARMLVWGGYENGVELADALRGFAFRALGSFRRLDGKPNDRLGRR